MFLTTTLHRTRLCPIPNYTRYNSFPSQKRWLQSQPTGKPFRVLFLGRDEFSSCVLKQLHAAKDLWSEIVCVTQPEDLDVDCNVDKNVPEPQTSPLGRLVRKLGLPVHYIPPGRKAFRQFSFPEPFSRSNIQKDQGKYLPSDYIVVTASFGRILTNSHLLLFDRDRRLNVHPSLLPKYRGPAPIQYTLLNDDRETGVCVLEMTKKTQGIDVGDLWGVERIPVPSDANFASLRDELAQLGGQLLVSTLRKMMHESLTSLPQNSEGDSQAPMITSSDSQLNFSKMTAEYICRLQRAISHQKSLTTSYRLPSSFYTAPLKNNAPPLKAWLPIQLTDFEIPSESPPLSHLSLDDKPGSYAFSKVTKLLYVRCASGSILSVKQLKPAGGKEMDAMSFWNGVWAAVGREKRKRVQRGLTGKELKLDPRELYVFGGVDLA